MTPKPLSDANPNNVEEIVLSPEKGQGALNNLRLIWNRTPKSIYIIKLFDCINVYDKKIY